MTSPNDDELIERLRAYKPYSLQGKPFGPAVCEQAATRLTELKEERDRAEHFLKLRTRQLFTCNRHWFRAAKEALAGKPNALRNRVEMAEAPPVDIALSTQGKQGDE